MDGWDPLERLGPDLSFGLLDLLADPADLIRASSVSRAWLRFVIANGFCKKLCLRICPDVSSFTHVIEIEGNDETVEVGCSTSVEWENLEKDHRVYAYLAHCLISPLAERDFIAEPLGASSTDNYPAEGIENTLEPSDRVGARPSYWSSRGQRDSGVPETLTYRLSSRLCVITEIRIQPFKAYFQYNDPIYSAKVVRFRMGYPRTTQEMETDKRTKYLSGQELTDDKYIWTYVSAEFSMVHIELMGRVQQQAEDDLYYVCVSHVEIMGYPLSHTFDVGIRDSMGDVILKCFPEAGGYKLLKETSENGIASAAKGATSRHASARGDWLWQHFILNNFLGALAIIDGADDSEDSDGEIPA